MVACRCGTKPRQRQRSGQLGVARSLACAVDRACCRPPPRTGVLPRRAVHRLRARRALRPEPGHRLADPAHARGRRPGGERQPHRHVVASGPGSWRSPGRPGSEGLHPVGTAGAGAPGPADRRDRGARDRAGRGADLRRRGGASRDRVRHVARPPGAAARDVDRQGAARLVDRSDGGLDDRVTADGVHDHHHHRPGRARGGARRGPGPRGTASAAASSKRRRTASPRRCSTPPASRWPW